MRRRLYNVAGFIVLLEDHAGTNPLESFIPFEMDAGAMGDASPDFIITLTAFDEAHPPVSDDMELLSEDLVNRIYIHNNQLIKRTAMREGDPRCMWTVMRMDDHTKADVFIPNTWLDYENYGNAFMFEKMLLSRGAIMLHCSLIDTRYGGIAFTAPSQTGKSTQAGLWLKNRDARILNGDRAIIRNVDGVIYAYGSPWAGSSEVYENAAVQLTALVGLAQAPVNTIRPLSHYEALQYIMAGTSLPLWDDTLFTNGMDTIESMLTRVPTALLSCTPDIRAVEALEEFILNHNQKLAPSAAG